MPTSLKSTDFPNNRHGLRDDLRGLKKTGKASKTLPVFFRSDTLDLDLKF